MFRSIANRLPAGEVTRLDAQRLYGTLVSRQGRCVLRAQIARRAAEEKTAPAGAGTSRFRA